MRHNCHLSQGNFGFKYARLYSLRKIPTTGFLDASRGSLCPRHTLRYPGSDSNLCLSRSIWCYHLEPSASLSPVGEPRRTILLSSLLGVRCYRHEHLSELGVVLQRSIALVPYLDQHSKRCLRLLHHFDCCHTMEHSVFRRIILCLPRRVWNVLGPNSGNNDG